VRSWLIGLGLTLICLVLAAFAVWHLAVERFEGPGPLAAERIVIVPRGAGVERIAQTLADSGVIEDVILFQLGVRVLEAGRRLKAGEYRFPAAVSMHGAVAILEQGQTVVHSLTVPEGLTSAQTVALVAAAEALSGEIGAVPGEGSLLPETYHFKRDDERAALLGRMAEAMDRTLAALWAARAKDLPLKTPDEALVLASMIERETGVAGERPLVASVFVNRLRRGMRLQSDPTVVYGITGGQAPLGRALTRQDLQAPTAYNTYTIDGLPPGPIANPGRAALEAALRPTESPYLYFVADGTGGHAFASTLQEHNRNVAKWRKVQKQSGG
jgi:UPF0755 protein